MNVTVTGPIDCVLADSHPIHRELALANENDQVREPQVLVETDARAPTNAGMDLRCLKAKVILSEILRWTSRLRLFLIVKLIIK